MPQRPVHRARHQADRRLHVGALADRARVRDEGRPLARAPRRAARAHHGGREGVGAGRRGRAARVLGAADRARHGRGADRPARRPRRHGSAAWKSTSSIGSSRDPSRTSCAPSARRTTRGPSRTSGSSRTSIIECTGVGQVIADAVQAVGAGGIVCLTGVGSGGRATGLATADVAAAMVLRNNVVVGSVNANKRHWYKAGEVLARADRSWLGAARDPARAAGGFRAPPWSGGPTTSRSSSSSPSPDGRPRPPAAPPVGVGSSMISLAVSRLVPSLLAAAWLAAAPAGAAEPSAPPALTAPPPTPLLQEYRYRMSAAIRPLLFWVGSDERGGGAHHVAPRQRGSRLRAAARGRSGARAAQDQPLGLGARGPGRGGREHDRPHPQDRRKDPRRVAGEPERRGQGGLRLQGDPGPRGARRRGGAQHRVARRAGLHLPRPRGSAEDRRRTRAGEAQRVAPAARGPTLRS